MENKLDMGHARALLSLESAQQILLANKIVLEGLSVREAEKLVKKQTHEPEKDKPKKVHKLSRDTQRLQEEMSAWLGTRVEIKPGSKGGGKLVIEYTNHDQLDEFLSKLKKGK
jgi:ParB family transcriptional regulator, chromosome partitioning protein